MAIYSETKKRELKHNNFVMIMLTIETLCCDDRDTWSKSCVELIVAVDGGRKEVYEVYFAATTSGNISVEFRLYNISAKKKHNNLRRG